MIMSMSAPAQAMAPHMIKEFENLHIDKISHDLHVLYKCIPSWHKNLAHLTRRFFSPNNYNFRTLKISWLMRLRVCMHYC